MAADATVAVVTAASVPTHPRSENKDTQVFWHVLQNKKYVDFVINLT